MNQKKMTTGEHVLFWFLVSISGLGIGLMILRGVITFFS